MNPIHVLRAVFWAALATGFGASAHAQARPDSLPEGVTAAMIASGRQLFAGGGLCRFCHGADGRGSIGPDLTDGEWLHGTGSFADIAARVLSGVGSGESRSGQIMPPRGGSGLDDAQVRAVAAYVWSLGRRSPRSADQRGGPPGPRPPRPAPDPRTP